MDNDAVQAFVDNTNLQTLITFLKNGHKNPRLFLVGGALRDILLGREVVDIDLVVGNIPSDTLQETLDQHGHVKPIGRRFGVLQFHADHIAKGRMLDIALPRTEQATSDNVGGYREFATDVDPMLPIEDDLSRRDFTVNAMAYGIHDQTLVDPFAGRSDLQSKLIRAVGKPKKRFEEDMSRMLRAVRFAVQLDFDIEQDTFAVIRELADDINKRYDDKRFVVPREVVAKELAKALNAAPKRTLMYLYKTGLGQQLAPTLTQRLIRNPHRLKPVEDAGLTALVGAFLAIIPPGDRSRFWELTGLETLPQDGPLGLDKRTAGWIAEQLDKGFENPLASEPADFENRWMNERGRIYKIALRILGHERVANAADEREKEIRERLHVEAGENIPELIDGSDVLRFTEPGPQIGELLHEVRNAQLKKDIETKEEALALLKKKAE
jgi:tRNA nucleotidyltransferase/poly(A) polymerase